MNKVEIKGTKEGYGTKVFIDGVEIHRVRSVRYEVSTETVPTVKLDILVGEGDISAEGKVELCSTSTTIDDLVLNRSTEELYLFSKKILKEISKRCENVQTDK